MTEANPSILTSIEACEYLRVGDRTLRRLAGSGRLSYHKVGHLLRFRREDLDAYLASVRIPAVG